MIQSCDVMHFGENIYCRRTSANPAPPFLPPPTASPLPLLAQPSLPLCFSSCWLRLGPLLCDAPGAHVIARCRLLAAQFTLKACTSVISSNFALQSRCGSIAACASIQYSLYKFEGSYIMTERSLLGFALVRARKRSMRALSMGPTRREGKNHCRE